MISTSAIPRSRCSRRSRSSSCAWIVTSSAVVGSSAISTSGSGASAIATAARWRSPPESWCGYCASRRSGSGTPTSSSSSTARRRAAPRRQSAVRLEALRDLPTDREQRVEARHRVLEDHARCAGRGAAAAPAARRPAASTPSSITRPPDDVAGGRQQAHDREDVTLLPQPDSPTSPSVSPGSISNETPRTAGTEPSRVANAVCRSSTARIGVTVGPGTRTTQWTRRAWRLEPLGADRAVVDEHVAGGEVVACRRRSSTRRRALEARPATSS